MNFDGCQRAERFETPKLGVDVDGVFRVGLDVRDQPGDRLAYDVRTFLACEDRLAVGLLFL